MLVPYTPSRDRNVRLVENGPNSQLLSIKKIMMALPVFALLSILVPTDLHQYLRNLAEKCVHNVYANSATVFNVPEPPPATTADVPSYISMCQEWIKREAGLGPTQHFFRNEHLDVCMDWTAPHANMMDLFSSAILASVVPGIRYRHECGRTRTWDEAVIGCDHTTFQQGFPLTNMVADTNIMSVVDIMDQCKAALMDYDPVLEKTRRKAYIYHHPFAWPETAGLPDNFVAPTTRRLLETTIDTSEQDVDPNENAINQLRFLQNSGSRNSCTAIDFSKAGDGTVLTNEHYVRHEWLNKYRFSITVTPTAGSGYSPQGKARIFDTSKPGANDATGDPDLGSPNVKCPGGGVGIGAGGEPGHPGENCAPLGNILIIQESDKRWADDNHNGGAIEFKFETPMKLEWMGFMGLKALGNLMEIVTADGKTSTVHIPSLGYNSVQEVVVNKDNVVKVTVRLTMSGAITGLGFCGFDKVAIVPSLSPAQSVPGKTCEAMKFSVDSLGNKLTEKNYVNDEFYDMFGGVTITASSTRRGYTPGGRARIFDTSKIINSPRGDPNLASPNEKCVGGGPGKGAGGEPGSVGENCIPLGNAIIVQESDKDEADDNSSGGSIAFDFDYPLTVFSVGLLGVEGDADIIEIVKQDGSTRYARVKDLGKNSMQWLSLGDKNVKRLVIHFESGGAIAGLNLCDFLVPGKFTPAPTLSPNSAPVPSIPQMAQHSKVKRQEKIALQTVIPSIINRIGKMATNFKEVTDIPPHEEKSGLVIYLDVQSAGIKIESIKKYISASGINPTSITILVNPLCMTANLPTGQRCQSYAEGLASWFKTQDYPNIGNTGFEGGPGIRVQISCSTAASASRMVRTKLLLCLPSTPSCLLPALAKSEGTNAILLARQDEPQVFEFFNYMGASEHVKIVNVDSSTIPSPSPGPSTTAYYTTNGMPAAKVFHSVNDRVIGEGYRKGTVLKPTTTLERASILSPKQVMMVLRPKIPQGGTGSDEFNPVFTDYRAKAKKNEWVPDAAQILAATTSRGTISNNVKPSRDELDGANPADVATQLGVDLDVGFATRALTPALFSKLTTIRKESMKRIGLSNAYILSHPVSDKDPINPGDSLEIYCPPTTEQGEPVKYNPDGTVITTHGDGKLTTVSDGGGTVTFVRNTMKNEQLKVIRDADGKPSQKITDPLTGKEVNFPAMDVYYHDNSGVPKVNGAAVVSFDGRNNATILITEGGTGSTSNKEFHMLFEGTSVATGSGRTPGATVIRHEKGYGFRWGERRDSKFYGFLPTEPRPIDAHSHTQSYLGKEPILHQYFVPIPIDTAEGNRVGFSDARNRRLDKFVLPAETFQFGRDLEQICKDLRTDKVQPSGGVEILAETA